MNSYKLFFALFLITFFSYSQIEVTGVVKDSVNTIEFANVFLTDTNNQIITGTITDDYGFFNLSAIEGNYTLTISFIGYEDWSKTILLKSNQDIGVIILNEDSSKLDEVVVTARKKLIERKVDRLVFNVENSIAATGGNAVDALKVTPRIRVQNDEISMIGKNKMVIMINGRVQQLSGKDLTSFLESFSSDGIKSIEVLSNPPAKYSAEGNSGLINIVTKKGHLDAWNASLRSSYRQATYATGYAGIRLNLQKGKFTIQSSFDYYNGSTAPVETNQIYYPEITWRTADNRRDFINSFSVRLGLQYKINHQLSTGFSYKRINNKPLFKSNEKTRLYNATSAVLDSSLVTHGRSPHNKKINLLNYHFVYEMDTIGRKLSLDFDFFDLSNQNDRTFNYQIFDANYQPVTTSYIEARNDGLQDIWNYSLNLDVEHPIAWASLNYGGRISSIKTDNLFEYYDIKNSEEILNPMLSNRFIFQEKTQALYFSAKKRFSEKWETKVGLRLESTQTEGYSQTLNQTNTIDYFKWFPTVYLVYHFNDDNTFDLNYGRRIRRPNYDFLNPFRWISNPYSYTEGNPFLQPAFIDNVELGYSYKNKWFTSIYYSYTDDDFEQIAVIDSATTVQQIVPENFIENHTIGIDQTFSFKPLKWWNVYTSANVYYSITDSKIPVSLQYLSGWNGTFNISNDLTLNNRKSLFFNISFYYATKGVSNLDYSSGANQLDASLKWLLLDKKMTVNLYANDILSSYRPTYTSYSNGVKNSFRNYYDQRYFRLSLTYNFGESFKTVNRKSKNQEELNRIN